MDFLLKALGLGLTIAGAKKIKHNIGEEIKRKNTICRFDGGITNHRRAFQPLLYKALRRFFVQKG